MNNKYILILLSVILYSTNVKAQQLLTNNQYLYNKFSLSPAYAGFTGHTEAFAAFKQEWTGVQGAPEYKNINLNGARDEKMGFGLNISSDKVGIFNEFNAQLAYAYHLQIDKNMGLHFGINAGLYNNRVDIASIYTSSTNDPVALSYLDYHGTAFDAGFGLMFNYDNFTVGLSVPRILGSKINYSEDYNLNYTLARHYQAHIAYNHQANDEWSLEPVVVLRKAQNSPLFYEGGIILNYNKVFWMSAQYKKGNTFGLGVGAAFSERFVANYSYEFGNKGIYAIASGSHEVSIGFLLKYNENLKHPVSIFTDKSDLKDKYITDKRIKENQENIRTLNKEIKKLQNQLKECCNGSSEIKDLQDKIELLEIEIKDLSSIKIEEVQYEAPFVLENITFEMNSDALKTSSFRRLDELVTEMKDKPNSTIKIVGYTDNTGGENYNLLLSKKRAMSVKDYLVTQGIEAHRIITLGLGKANPIASNSTNEGRAQNRRIEASFSTNK